MTSEFDSISTILNQITYYIDHKEGDKNEMLNLLNYLQNWVQGLHTFAHDLGRKTIKIDNKYQTDHFTSTYKDTAWIQEIIRRHYMKLINKR